MERLKRPLNINMHFAIPLVAWIYRNMTILKVKTDIIINIAAHPEEQRY
jgi:hypothetical protein